LIKCGYFPLPLNPDGVTFVLTPALSSEERENVLDLFIKSVNFGCISSCGMAMLNALPKTTFERMALEAFSAMKTGSGYACFAEIQALTLGRNLV
jgi:hypothetical protein